MTPDLILILLLALIGLLSIGVLVAFIISKFKSKKVKERIKKISQEDKYIAIDELRKYLRSNPNDYDARGKLIDLLFESNMYLPALKECHMLINASASHPQIDEMKYTVKVGEAYYWLKNFQEAKKYLNIARKIDESDWKVNYLLAKMEYDNQTYDKAYAYINSATKTNNEDIDVLKLKGLISSQLNLNKETINCMLAVLKENGDDMEAVFYLAKSYFNVSRMEEAKKYLDLLTDHPNYSAEVLFLLGNIHYKDDMFSKAIDYLNDAIKTGLLKPKMVVEAHYAIAECYVKIHNIQNALHHLEEIRKSNPNYKDIQKKIEMYSQLNLNSLFEKYLIGSVSQFTNICKLIVKYYIQKLCNLSGTIKFDKVNMNYRGELEIFVEIVSKKFTSQYYFTFFRSTTTVGDLVVRNIYNMLREQKFDKGICVTAGDFSNTAHTFIESRMLEIIEKKALIDILEKIRVIIQKQSQK